MKINEPQNLKFVQALEAKIRQYTNSLINMAYEALVKKKKTIPNPKFTIPLMLV